MVMSVTLSRRLFRLLHSIPATLDHSGNGTLGSFLKRISPIFELCLIPFDLVANRGPFRFCFGRRDLGWFVPLFDQTANDLKVLARIDQVWLWTEQLLKQTQFPNIRTAAVVRCPFVACTEFRVF